MWLVSGIKLLTKTWPATKYRGEDMKRDNAAHLCANTTASWNVGTVSNGSIIRAHLHELQRWPKRRRSWRAIVFTAPLVRSMDAHLVHLSSVSKKQSADAQLNIINSLTVAQLLT